MRPRRLVFAGQAIVDIVLRVPALPERGGDMIATSAEITTGGGFNVMAAAARQGLPVLYAGGHGTYYYYSARRCIDDRRSDGDVHCRRFRNRPADLPVARGRSRDIGRDRRKLHHACRSTRGRRCNIHCSGDEFGGKCDKR